MGEQLQSVQHQRMVGPAPARDLVDRRAGHERSVDQALLLAGDPKPLRGAREVQLASEVRDVPWLLS